MDYRSFSILSVTGCRLFFYSLSHEDVLTLCHKLEIIFYYLCHKSEIIFYYLCHKSKIIFYYLCHRSEIMFYSVCHRWKIIFYSLLHRDYFLPFIQRQEAIFYSLTQIGKDFLFMWQHYTNTKSKGWDSTQKQVINDIFFQNESLCIIWDKNAQLAFLPLDVLEDKSKSGHPQCNSHERKSEW